MKREYYMWCLVDRYLSMWHISYTEALNNARRDVYEVASNRDNLKVLASQCTLRGEDVARLSKEAPSAAVHQ